jgi:hypothetical protein
VPVNPNVDQEVAAAMPHGGSQAFRMSSDVTSGSFGDMPFSPSLTDRAGEPGSIAGGFAGGTLRPRFTTTIWFKVGHRRRAGLARGDQPRPGRRRADELDPGQRRT